MVEAVDLIVLGGGCAGLSLCRELTALGKICPRTVVIESRKQYLNDRTWCYWGDDALPNKHRVQHRWHSMRVSYADTSVRLSCGSTPYQMLAAEDFYADTQAAIAAHPHTRLKLGTVVVGDPVKVGGLWHVQTSAGVFSSAMLVDTRPALAPVRDGAVLWQSFYGREIECSAAVFDPLCVDLMDFLPPHIDHIPFVYVLPISPTRALVEVTVFGASPLAPAALRQSLDTAVARRTGAAPSRVVRSEHGILPMGLVKPVQHPDPSRVRVGLTAGAARPSTGYAFQRIQRWAQECALSISTTGLPVGHRPDPAPLRAMDRLFLDVLRADPRGGGQIFFSLFSAAHTPRVIRFLSGLGRVDDALAVVAAMPFKPFIRAALTPRFMKPGPKSIGWRA